VRVVEAHLLGETANATSAKERIAFGQPILDFQTIQFKLADMETVTAAARELLYKACEMARSRRLGLAKSRSSAGTDDA
jgi:alkylation response protein AidB-like acyl-CoA dehydrogenase